MAAINNPNNLSISRFVTKLTYFILFAITLSANAEIYKYKDPHGRWQYTDKPPENSHSETLAIDTAIEDVLPTDLHRHLLNKYQPRSPIERATLSVVKVNTALGSGSGFFISETGYLITNRHVVRPPKASLDQIQLGLSEQEARLSQEKERLSSQRAQLREYKHDLDNHAEYIDGLHGAEKTREQKIYANRSKQYQRAKKNLAKFSRRLKESKQQLTKQITNLSRRHSVTMISKQFEITLKDNTPLQAQLVRVSSNHDLALLKVDDYITPHIDIEQADTIRQGLPVFAVGSPLGNTDYVTSGIVTSIKKDNIVFDAQILPGNSGGPLISEQGVAVGVNTWKLLTHANQINDGFGIAIPINVALKEFGDAIGEQRALPQEADSNTPKNLAPTTTKNDLLRSITEEYQKHPSK